MITLECLHAAAKIESYFFLKKTLLAQRVLASAAVKNMQPYTKQFCCHLFILSIVTEAAAAKN